MPKLTPLRRIADLEAELSQLKEVLAAGDHLRPITCGLRSASKLFGQSVSTLRYLCQTGQLAGIAFKVGGNWLIHVAQYERRIINAGSSGESYDQNGEKYPGE